jgi:hypothetical protein
MGYSNYTVPDIKNSPCQSITKPESEYIAISEGEYINKLHSKCSDLDIYNNIAYKPTTNRTEYMGSKRYY